MTTDPTRMLQLLEPAVRPGAVKQASATPQGRAPFEARSFQDLLDDASSESGPTQSQGTNAEKQNNLLAGLGGLGQIENAALRSVLTQAQQGMTK